jgi:CDP-diacylglycerol pyrophosphatase
MSRRIGLIFVLGVGAVLALAFPALCGDRDALWTIAHDQCVPDEQAHDNPAPCARVDLGGGYVILKDRVGAMQFLLIAIEPISGIESPDILLPDAEDYWADAWQNRTYVVAAAKRDLAWDMIGLAINSAFARSQDQLHIHIDCIAPDVRALLAEHRDEIGATWAELSFDLRGERYFARRLGAADLAADDPFKLLAKGVGAQNMARETLVMVGVVFAPAQNGLVLLARADSPGHRAHGEDLLDHNCALAKAD